MASPAFGDVLRLLQPREHGQRAGLCSPEAAGCDSLSRSTRSPVSPGCRDTAGGSQQPARRLGGAGREGGGIKPGANIAMQDSFYCMGRAAGAGQRSRERPRASPWAQPGEQSSSAGTVSGLGAPGAPWGCSGGAGTGHGRFPSCHEAPKALLTGFACTQRRVGMSRGFSWSSRRSEAALAVGLSRAHSCH